MIVNILIIFGLFCIYWKVFSIIKRYFIFNNKININFVIFYSFGCYDDDLWFFLLDYFLEVIYGFG